MTYNTQRTKLIINEYGRAVHHMAQFLLTIEDKDKRQKNAESLIEIMAILNSQLKGVEDVKQRYWDHLFALTDYKLDVESPYGFPEKEAKEAKPDIIAYPTRKIRWNHLGKNVERLFDNAMKEQDADKKKGYAQALGLYMKTAYKNNHDESVTDDVVKEELANMSDGQLIYEAAEFKKWVDGTLSDNTIIHAPKNNVRNDVAVTGRAYYNNNNEGMRGNGGRPQNNTRNAGNMPNKNKFKFKRR
jgi:Domain of unknown function (DUF4290)